MTRGRAAFTLAALVPLLGGCAAVVVLPAVMGAGLMARSDHPAQAPEVAQWVRSSGLDPQGQDQFLLLRTADDRKQLLREDANKDVCVVAVAGDARGDFDELFDYFRDPAGAIGLEPMMGRGWFEVPPLSAAAAAAASSLAP